MGDFTLAVHMFVLLPFRKDIIELHNYGGKIGNDVILGAKCYAIWKPEKSELREIIEALSYASADHKKDLIDMLS